MHAAPPDECSPSLSTYIFDIPAADHSIVHVILRGHKVVGGGYTGNLLCTGLTHWRVAELTSRYICSRSKLFQNKSVLELGCGLGLCGIVAGNAWRTENHLTINLIQETVACMSLNYCIDISRTAYSVGLQGRVLLTDGDFEVLDIASDNVKSNNVQNVARASLLKWDDIGTAKSILKQYFDNDQGRKGFDVIVGSDCLYSGMEAVQQLFSLVDIMLAENIDIATGTSFESNETTTFNNMGSNCQDFCDERDNGVYDNNDDDDHLSPTSVDGGGWMLVDSGPERSMTADSYDSSSDLYFTELIGNCVYTSEQFTASTKSNKRKWGGRDVKPVFILGYERRLGGANVDMYAMFKIAASFGFEWCIAEDSVVDIFGNETSEQTLLWEQCIFLFTRKASVKTE